MGALVLVCLLPLWAVAGQRPVTIKLATLAPEGTIFYEQLLKLGQEWNRVSDGAVRLKIYAGGIAGSEYDMVRKMRIGQLQAATISSLGMMLIDPSYAALQVPGVMGSYAELDYCRERLAPDINQRFADKGYVILNYSDLGHMYFFTTEPVASVDQLQRRKVCTFASDRMSKEIWARAGFKIVDVSMNEMLTALHTGLAQGFINSPVLALSYQLFGKARYMVDTSYGIAIASTIVRKRDWDRIDPDLQVKLRQVAEAVSRQAQPEIRALDQRAIEQMRSYGLELIPVSAAERETWLAPVKAVYPLIGAELIPGGVFEKTLKLRDRYRAQQAAPADS